MKRLLITGFDPFGGELKNPSWECVNALPDVVGGFELFKLGLPTVFGEAAKTCIAKAKEIRPDVILCVGLAGGRANVTPEAIALNFRDAGIPDNEGYKANGEPVVQGGETALVSTVNAKEIATSLSERGLPCRISYSAGTFVCNDLLYSLLERFKGEKVRVGFVHVPYFPEQAKEGVPSLEKEKTVEVLEEIIKLL